MMKNFKIFHNYCKQGNRELAVMVNPMRVNWDEMIDFAIFCKEKKTQQLNLC